VNSLREALGAGSLRCGGYQDGRIVDLRSAPSKSLYLVGDIHAKWERIRILLEQTGLEEALTEESAILVFLGDLFHPEDRDEAGRMESSVQTFRTVMELKCRWPRSVYFLLGNHEFTRTGGTKRGFFQGDLFREALESEGLFDTYTHFLQESPLVVVHPRVVGVHAGPARSASTLEELKSFQVVDGEPHELSPIIRELSFSRHVDWSPNPEKHYCDHHVEDFLALCDASEARLVTGHTPLDRSSDWMWRIGRFLTVIFAAGRELGYYRVDSEEERFVRLGRFYGEQFVADRSSDWRPSPGQTLSLDRGCRYVEIKKPGSRLSLCADMEYRLEYPGRAFRLLVDGEQFVTICHYRHLPVWAQAYYAMGYYLLGNTGVNEILQIKNDLAVVVGGEQMVEGVRFSWEDREVAVLRREEDRFFIRPLLINVALDFSP